MLYAYIVGDVKTGKAYLTFEAEMTPELARAAIARGAKARELLPEIVDNLRVVDREGKTAIEMKPPVDYVGNIPKLMFQQFAVCLKRTDAILRNPGAGLKSLIEAFP